MTDLQPAAHERSQLAGPAARDGPRSGLTEDCGEDRRRSNRAAATEDSQGGNAPHGTTEPEEAPGAAASTPGKPQLASNGAALGRWARADNIFSYKRRLVAIRNYGRRFAR